MQIDLSPDALAIYLEKRVQRQIGWFIDSRDRLEYIADRRNGLLLGFYVAMAVFAAVKFGLFLFWEICTILYCQFC